MTHNNARLQSAVIIVSDPDQDSKILNIPADANGRTFTLDLTRGNTQLADRARFKWTTYRLPHASHSRPDN